MPRLPPSRSADQQPSVGDTLKQQDVESQQITQSNNNKVDDTNPLRVQKIDPRDLPPRTVNVPLDYALAVVNPAPMFAFHSNDRRWIWPVVLVEFAALCLWVAGTGACMNGEWSLEGVKEAFKSFVSDPLRFGFGAMQALVGVSSDPTLKQWLCILAVSMHLIVIMASLGMTYASSLNQSISQTIVLRPVHISDFVMLLVDDSAMSGMQMSNRVIVSVKSLMRALLLFNYLPQAVVTVFMGEKAGFPLTMVNVVMFAIHVGMAGFVLWRHMQKAGITSVF